MDSVIKRMYMKKEWKDDYGNKIMVHGFRSIMRDYVADQTDFDTAAERAYRRGDLLEKRRAFMQFYGDYSCGMA